MGLENNYISLPCNWSGGVWAVTIVTLVVLAGTGFYLESLKWPTSMLWLKYLLTIFSNKDNNYYEILKYAGAENAPEYNNLSPETKDAIERWRKANGLGE